MKDLIGNNLRILRGDRNQEETAELLGLSRNAYANYEKELCYPKYETIIKISNLYSISIDDFLKKELKYKDFPPVKR